MGIASLAERSGQRSPQHVVVRVAIGLVALHVVDDSFVQPQPGTSATDHLVSGLVPLALLAAAAIVYPRLRAGTRAIVALTVGFLATVGGIAEAAYSTAKVGPSGDDFTGLAMLAAGLVLLATGVVVLWRSRRLDEPRPRRYARRGLLAVGAALVAFLVVVPVALSYAFTHVGRPVVPAPDLGATHEDVTFTTEDGLVLQGWYIPSRNGAAVIAFPGRSGPQRHARMLVRHGYGVLLFDRRGEGESQGDPGALGWGMDRDLRAALDYLRRRPDVEGGRIGGLGLSVGGELLLETAAESDVLRAVVSEGAGIRSVREALETSGAGRVLSVPYWAATTVATAVFSNQLPPPSLKDLVGRISPRPVLLIHATKGQGGEELNPVYFAAAREPKERWEIPEAGHTGGLEARPEEYERRVVAFLDRALLGGDPP